MATIGKWSNGTTTLLPGTSWTAPNGLFGTEDRNDSSAYTFTNSTATLTLPSSGLADGYIIVARVEWEDTSNGRFQPIGRFVQTGGTGNFVSLNSAGYNRDNSEDRSYIHPMAFIDGPSAGATIQFQYSRDTDSPSGGTVRSVLEVYPVYYSNVGVYASASTSCPGGTTPTLVTGWSATTQSDTAAIELVSNEIQLKGDNKRYLVLGGNHWEGIGNSRTQRWFGLEVDGSLEDAAKAYCYARNSSNDRIAETYSWLLETATATVTIGNVCYRGAGVASGQGGANADGNTTGSNPAHGLVVLELNDDAEVFCNTGSTNQNVATTGPVDVTISQIADINFNDAASWGRESDTQMEAEVAMDALLGFNISSASQNVGTGQRWTGFAELTVGGVEDTDFFAGDYLRNNQGTQDTFGWSANAVGFQALSATNDVGVSVTELPGSEGGGGANHIQAGWAGFWGINLDTMEASGGGVDSVTVSNVEANSEVSTTSIGQEHNVSGTGVETASEVSTISIQQEHVISCVGVEAQFELGQPSIGQDHVVSGTGVEAQFELGQPNIGQDHVVSPIGVQAQAELTSPNVGQSHVVSPQSLEAQAELTSPNVSTAGGVDNVTVSSVEAFAEVSTTNVIVLSDIGAVPHDPQDYDRRAKERLRRRQQQEERQKPPTIQPGPKLPEVSTPKQPEPDYDAEIARAEAQLAQARADKQRLLVEAEVKRLQEEEEVALILLAS